jgi:hypothetical protein
LVEVRYVLRSGRGVARAISPDAPCGHPGLRSLDAGYASGILPSLASNAVSIGTGNPSRQPFALQFSIGTPRDRLLRGRLGTGCDGTSRELEFTGSFFCDATGHATIGHLAGAETVMEPKGRMGMSNMWAWANRDASQAYPETPWALPLDMADFPYPRDFHGQWFWESGLDKDPLGDAEGIRDWNLRAVYGAFNAMKNGDGAAEHPNAVLTWVAFVGGPRESRRILGDVVLTQDDIVTKREFPDGWIGIMAIQCPTAASIPRISKTCSWPAAASPSRTRPSAPSG